MYITIRKAKKKDLPSILKLIHELATFEKAPAEVKVSLKELERDGFGRKKIFDCLIAETGDNKIAGMALYFVKYSTWKGKCLYLDDLIVTEAMRKHGVGKKLFEAVLMIAEKMKVRKFEWQVLDWNKPAIGFYKKYNAQFDNAWINCKIVLE